MITSPIKIWRIASTAFRLRTITDHFRSLEVVDLLARHNFKWLKNSNPCAGLQCLVILRTSTVYHIFTINIAGVAPTLSQRWVTTTYFTRYEVFTRMPRVRLKPDPASRHLRCLTFFYKTPHISFHFKLSRTSPQSPLANLAGDFHTRGVNNLFWRTPGSVCPDQVPWKSFHILQSAANICRWHFPPPLLPPQPRLWERSWGVWAILIIYQR